jgi:DNA-binding beta-propeller fold protein YncE
MSRSRRWSLLYVAASVLWAGCNSGGVNVPSPSNSPAPPVALGRGTVAVTERTPTATRVLIFPPHSDKFTQEFSIGGSRLVANSLAFDRRGHLYVGINDPSAGGKYEVLELNIQSRKIVREITGLPSWSHSSVATDGENFLYVNTKALVGGDVKLYRPADTKPWLEIKDSLSPLTVLVARDSLWVGYEGAFADALARYRLRSRDRTWFTHTSNYLPLKLAVNPEGSLVAAKFRRNSRLTVAVTDVKSGKREQILEGSSEAMTSDDSGHLYIAELHGKIRTCTFHGCSHSFETNFTNLALAVSPLDGMLYVACSGKSSIQVYDPRTGSQVMYIPIPGGFPSHLAIEP